MPRSHLSPHSRPVFLEIVFRVKGEVIHSENDTNEVAKGFLRDVFISTFLKEITASINSFVMLVYSDVTSSVTSRALSGSLFKTASLLKKICSVFDVGRYGAD